MTYITELYMMIIMRAWSPEDIKILRSSLGLSQVLFGKRVGVSGTYVYLLEKGVKTPSETLKLLLGYIEEETKRKEVKKSRGNRNLQKG